LEIERKKDLDYFGTSVLIWVITGVIFHKEELCQRSKSGEESRILARHCCQLSPVNDLQFAQDAL
jgi:hypothetical protein